LQQEILNRTLKLIEEVYDESMYGENDIYRIKDLIHSVDNNHWKSKQWLVDEFYKLYDHDQGSFYIGGGWYGLLSYLIRDKWPDENLNITSGDIDPRCEEFGWKLYHNSDINFVTEDMISSDLHEYSAIISTSCEHVEPDVLEKFIKSKNNDAWVVLQSNNYEELDSHINCQPDVMTFANWVEPLLSERVYFAGTLRLGDFDRFMVIGK
tara:strand:+ start:300 stop:926 length:627 start_codon:yes stop_codon:yes gene_type:complete